MGLENRLSQLTAVEWGKLLKRIRQYTDHSQLEASEMLNVGFTTYQKWEQGRRKPRPVYRRKIREVFNDAFLALESTRDKAERAKEEAISVSDGQEILAANTLTAVALSLPEQPERRENGIIVVSSLADLDPVNTFITGNMTMHLLNLVYTSHFSHSERQSTIQQAIKDFDAMNTTNKSYHMTRRDALSTLATLPAVTLGIKPGVTVQPTPTQHGTILEHCSASLEACWQLYRSSDASAAQLAFQCTSTYVPILITIAKDSAQYHKEALQLASQYALLKTLLGWGCAGATETIYYAQEAMALSKATNDILLQLSAYTKLGWAYSAGQKHRLAHQTMQEGESLLQNYQHMKNTPPLPSHAIGSFYSTNALVLSKNGDSPDTALGIATDSDTGDEHTAFTVFSQSAQWLEAAHTCCAKGDPVQAMKWIDKRIDLETLAPRKHVPQSERGRIETVNVLTRALLQSKERDMERIISVWTAGMEGAKVLKNEQRYNEAVTNFEGMQIMWPGESCIIKLRHLTEHW